MLLTVKVGLCETFFFFLTRVKVKMYLRFFLFILNCHSQSSTRAVSFLQTPASFFVSVCFEIHPLLQTSFIQIQTFYFTFTANIEKCDSSCCDLSDLYLKKKEKENVIQRFKIPPKYEWNSAPHTIAHLSSPLFLNSCQT